MCPRRSRELRTSRSVVIGDGAYGTALQEAGLGAGECGELWNLEAPEKVEAIHRGYAEAGGMFLTTNTFGGTAPRLAMHGLDGKVAEINRAGAEIARKVADDFPGVLVAGNIGPSGELIAPLGLLSGDEATDIFADQAAALAAGGVDFFLIETMSDMAEVEAAIAGAQRAAPDLEIIATMSFDTNLHTMMGVSPAAAISAHRRPRHRRCRRQLRSRAGGDGGDHDRDGRPAAPTGRYWSPSPTPACPISTEIHSSTTSSPSRWPIMHAACATWAST